MKKILSTLIIMTITLLTIGNVWADGVADARAFFNSYVQAANSYSSTVANMYSPNAKIIRQVVKPDGTTANAYTDTATYVKQMRLSQAAAKVKKYKNYYSNITVTDLGNGKYKVSSLRQPTGETYKLKTYMILQRQNNGSFKIVEEMMQTKQQIFLKYAK